MKGFDDSVSIRLYWAAMVSVLCIWGFPCYGGMATQRTHQTQPQQEQTQPLFATRGQVIDEEGNPVQGIEVCLEPARSPIELSGHGTRPGRSGLVRTRTDSEGRFRFTETPIPEGIRIYGYWNVFVMAPGKGLAWSRTRTSSTKEHTLQLYPESLLAGQVTGSDGTAIIGALVTISGIGERRQVSFGDEPENFSFHGSELSMQSTTDSEGKFAIHGLTQGKHIQFAVRHDGHLARYFHDVVTGNPDTTAMKIELVRERVVRARFVYDDTGLPASNIRVYGYPGKYGETDENGCVRFTKVAGTKFVFNSHQTPLPYTRTFGTAEFAGDEFEKGVLIRIALGGLIHGRLNNEDGNPVGRVRIIYFADNPNSLAQPHDFQETMTDASGEFKMSVEPGEGTIYAVGQVSSDGLPLLSHIWSIRHSDYQIPGVPHQRIEVRAGEPVEAMHWSVPLYLRADGVAEFSNGNLAGGATIRHLRGELSADQHPHPSPEVDGMTDYNGRFRIVGIPQSDGENALADHQGVFLFAADGGRFSSFLFPDSNNVYPKRVVLHSASFIRGVIGATDAEVSIVTTIDGRRVLFPKTKTDNDGKFIFRDLPTGYDYSIMYSEDLDIDPAEENTVVIEVKNLEEPVELKLNDQ